MGQDSAVSVRDLRNHGGDVLDRVTAGESLIVTRGGRPVAELRPLPSSTRSADVIVERWRHLPPVDAADLRFDVDEWLDQSL
jgi:prevent-host-death family protein